MNIVASAPTLVPPETFATALHGAKSIALSAYVLEPRSFVVPALERAAEGGARVAVLLAGQPFGRGGDAGRFERANAAVAAELRAHGVEVRLTGPSENALHMKAAVVDGRAFLNDRNWPNAGPDTIVATSDPLDVAAVKAALAGRPADGRNIATVKSGALALEAQAIYAGTGDRVEVESESFGGSAVSEAIRYRATHGAHVRLLVAGGELGAPDSRERAALASLAALGVEVRSTSANEKLCVAGDSAWAGSANASFAPADEPVIDWGAALHSRSSVAGVAVAFERNWASASPRRF